MNAAEQPSSPATFATGPTPGTAPAGGRVIALDALRGFAILTMVLSGMLRPYHLPNWMYHAQVAPPDFHFDPNRPGLTWVDLVFPFFLFSMGAAFPLALARRVAIGERSWCLVLYALQRGGLLLLFALYVAHVGPGLFQKDGQVSIAAYLWALGAFCALFPLLARLPRNWPTALTATTRLIGWALVIGLLATVRFPPGSEVAKASPGFWLGRSDIIIVVLAHTAAVGMLLWLVSRDHLLLRMGLILAVLATILGAEAPGWVRNVWHGQPQPWLEQLAQLLGVTPDPLPSTGTKLLLFGYLKYLLIVLPGTVAGDLLLAWSRAAQAESATTQRAGAFTIWRHAGMAVLAIGLLVLLLVGLQSRWLPETTFCTFAACAVGAALFVPGKTPLDRLLRGLYGWGVLWLAIGLLLEPYQGGIKKDHATLSYYFVTSGLACMVLICFTIWGLAARHAVPRAPLTLLSASGQNPMIAYIGVRNLLPPVLALSGCNVLIERLHLTAWDGFAWACTKTLLLALIVALLTRLRVYWRT